MSNSTLSSTTSSRLLSFIISLRRLLGIYQSRYSLQIPLISWIQCARLLASTLLVLRWSEQIPLLQFKRMVANLLLSRYIYPIALCSPRIQEAATWQWTNRRPSSMINSWVNTQERTMPEDCWEKILPIGSEFLNNAMGTWDKAWWRTH